MSSNKNDRDPHEIRVTDRRRINLDATEGDQPVNEEPNLKPSYVEELEARTKAAENQVQEVQSRFEQLRNELQRETDETRQRLNRAADERAQRENASFIAALLPVLDNLQRATDAAAESTNPADLVMDGIRRTIESFERALLAAGVEPVPAEGQMFDPKLHEAVEISDVEPDLEGQILAEYTRGYRMGDRLLRPARVKVGRSAAKSDRASR